MKLSQNERRDDNSGDQTLDLILAELGIKPPRIQGTYPSRGSVHNLYDVTKLDIRDN